MKYFQFIHFYPLVLHLDGAWDTFWIKSLNGTFIPLKRNNLARKKFKLYARVKKCHSGIFFGKGRDGHDLLVRPSKSNHSIWKILFLWGSFEYLKEKLENAYSFTAFPHIVSAETFLFWIYEIGANSNSYRNISIFYLINRIFAVETIQRRKLYEEISTLC